MSGLSYIKVSQDLDSPYVRERLNMHLAQGLISIDEVLMLTELHVRRIPIERQSLGAGFGLGPTIMKEVVKNLSRLEWIEIVEESEV